MPALRQRLQAAGYLSAEIETASEEAEIIEAEPDGLLYSEALAAAVKSFQQDHYLEDGVHLHVVVASLSEHVHHFANHVAVVLVGPLDDAHHGVVTVLAAFQLAARNDYAVSQHVCRRDERAEVVVERESSDEGVLGALQNSYHLRLLYVVLAASHASEAHAVAGESPHRVAFSHEDRLV